MRLLLTLLGCIILVIWFQLGYRFNGHAMVLTQILALVIIALICVAMSFPIRWVIRQAMYRWERSGRMSEDLPARRRMVDAQKSDEELKLEALDDAALERLIDKHPRYGLAVEVSCDRLKARGQWADYARQMQYLLTINNGMSIEEISTRYYELGEIYHHRLGRIDRAEEMIRAVIAAYPRHYQATEARRRLGELRKRAGQAEPDH